MNICLNVYNVIKSVQSVEPGKLAEWYKANPQAGKIYTMVLEIKYGDHGN